MTTVGGVELVTIPLSEYADLLECRRQLTELHLRANRSRTARSPVDCDAEVVAFLGERFGRMPVTNALAQCRARFGEGRTPSRSAAYRLWDRLRGLKRSS